jgi:hypothetical protein
MINDFMILSNQIFLVSMAVFGPESHLVLSSVGYKKNPDQTMNSHRLSAVSGGNPLLHSSDLKNVTQASFWVQSR